MLSPRSSSCDMRWRNTHQGRVTLYARDNRLNLFRFVTHVHWNGVNIHTGNQRLNVDLMQGVLQTPSDNPPASHTVTDDPLRRALISISMHALVAHCGVVLRIYPGSQMA